MILQPPCSCFPFLSCNAVDCSSKQTGGKESAAVFEPPGKPPLHMPDRQTCFLRSLTVCAGIKQEQAENADRKHSSVGQQHGSQGQTDVPRRHKQPAGCPLPVCADPCRSQQPAAWSLALWRLLRALLLLLLLLLRHCKQAAFEAQLLQQALCLLQRLPLLYRMVVGCKGRQSGAGQRPAALAAALGMLPCGSRPHLGP